MFLFLKDFFAVRLMIKFVFHSGNFGSRKTWLRA